jgi:choline dehydrogenase-like flavoprotein
MQIVKLEDYSPGHSFRSDLLIVGAGPVGLTIARELAGSGRKVFVLESGLAEENAGHNALLHVESVGAPNPEGQLRRRLFHGEAMKYWSAEDQGFGLRCRALGGSTAAWAGKSATFDDIDFLPRAWVENSGWPLAAAELTPFLDRAASVLNLGPNVYDDQLFKLLKVRPPEPTLRGDVFRSFFWQFARSRSNPIDVMRFGDEIADVKASNITIFVNATATHIHTTAEGDRFTGLEVATLEGARFEFEADRCVLAAGAIDTPRLMLASRRVRPQGVGNDRDLVGRFLMDHPGARLGVYSKEDGERVARLFGFYGVRAEGRSHMYARGLALSERFQTDAGLLNAAIYFLELRAPDDPWDALKRLINGRSARPLGDLAVALKSPLLLAKGLGLKLLSGGILPRRLRELIIGIVIQLAPELAAQEFQDRGLPHKIVGLAVDAILEQPPRRESRVSLSQRLDALGVPLARIDWHLGDQEIETLFRIASELKAEFSAIGLPVPRLEPWLERRDAASAPIIDMGHTSGSTRMSAIPETGVVDTNCKVHGVDGLYVAGSSVFPTIGHANSTLMALGLAIRLADHLRGE